MLKQVIVLRKDLKMRKGKMIAQGAHASLGVMSYVSKEIHKRWSIQGATKIALGIEGEPELLGLYDKALKANLPVYLVHDSGKTEFHGVPTYTAVAIGPAKADKIDLLTGELKLL